MERVDGLAYRARPVVVRDAFPTMGPDEIFAVADRYTVLRDGEYVGSGAVAQTTPQALIAMMVGRSVTQAYPKHDAAIGEPVLEVRDLSHPTEFDGVSFQVRRGEILGFYGLIGAGRSEVMQALFGLTTPSRGEVRLDGKTLAEIASLPAARGVFLRQIVRGAVATSIPILPDTKVYRGDILTIVGREQDTAAAVKMSIVAWPRQPIGPTVAQLWLA